MRDVYRQQMQERDIKVEKDDFNILGRFIL
jgi:hypothetical protein